MRDAGVDLVTVGVFSWASVETTGGRVRLRVAGRGARPAARGGHQVDLATGTASPPNWACAAYPDILPVDAGGARYNPGSRQHFSRAPNRTAGWPRRSSASLSNGIASTRQSHSGMSTTSTRAMCPMTTRTQLRNASETGCAIAIGISKPSTRFGTPTFWSQRYTSFDEIFRRAGRPYSHNPGLVLDFRRFTSDVTLELFDHGAGYHPRRRRDSADHDELHGRLPRARLLALGRAKSTSCRTTTIRIRAAPNAARHAAFGRDLMRSLKPDRPWILMEQAANTVNWRPNNARKAPGQMSAWSEQAVARGAGAILFFQWRQSVAGSEKFHSAMLPHAGPDTATFREVSAYGARCAARAARRYGARGRCAPARLGELVGARSARSPGDVQLRAHRCATGMRRPIALTSRSTSPIRQPTSPPMRS